MSTPHHSRVRRHLKIDILKRALFRERERESVFLYLKIALKRVVLCGKSKRTFLKIFVPFFIGVFLEAETIGVFYQRDLSRHHKNSSGKRHHKKKAHSSCFDTTVAKRYTDAHNKALSSSSHFKREIEG